MSLDCDSIAAFLPSILDGVEEAEEAVVSHVETCLRCQAELARYRRLLRLLGEFGAEPVEVPAGLAADVLRTIGQRARRHAVRSALSRRSLAYLFALTASLVAGVGVVMLRRTHSARTAEARS